MIASPAVTEVDLALLVTRYSMAAWSRVTVRVAWAEVSPPSRFVILERSAAVEAEVVTLLAVVSLTVTALVPTPMRVEMGTPATSRLFPPLIARVMPVPG